MRGAKQKKMFEISDLRRREILHLSVCFSPEGVGGGGEGEGVLYIFIHAFQYFWVFSEN